MKVCYCDESGTGDEPIAVMVGVIVDIHRMHLTKGEWKDLLRELSRIVGREITEIHTRDFYAGNGVWRGIPGPQRAETITRVFTWLSERKHQVVYTSVEKNQFYTSQKAGQIRSEAHTIWRFMGLHLLLAIQKAHQRMDGTKGNTIFVFDNEERERMRFTDLVRDPPAWTDSYYSKGKKQERLDQIVDVPYFADSTEVYLIQLADFLAYFLRRHAEIAAGYSTEKYTDEAAALNSWIEILKQRSLGGSVMYPAAGRCECAELFFKHAPDVIRKLHR